MALSAMKVDSLRRVMKTENLAAYIVYSEDQHQSEYTPIADKRREFISDFTGSAGIFVCSLVIGLKMEFLNS